MDFIIYMIEVYFPLYTKCIYPFFKKKKICEFFIQPNSKGCKGEYVIVSLYILLKLYTFNSLRRV